MLVIRAGLLIDGYGKPPLEDVVVFVEGERIMGVEPAEAADIPPNAELLDCRAQTLMPGMVDAHVHIELPGGPYAAYAVDEISHLQGYLTLRAYRNGLAILRAGFTTIRSLNSPAYEDIALRDAIVDGLVEGPRVRACGRGLTVTGGHMDKSPWAPEVSVFGQNQVCDGPDGFRRGAREQLKRGADVIKINAASYNLGHELSHQEMTYEEMAAACEVAHMAEKRVAAHAHGGPGITAAVRAGVDSIEHGLWLSDEQAELMAERGVYYVPTLWAHTRGLMLGLDGVGGSATIYDWVKRACEDRWISLERAHKAGVKIAVGTDSGFWVHHGENAAELAELVQGGLTPMEAIVAATRGGAECLDLAAEIGTVECGKLADLLLVDGNPLDDVRVLQEPARIAFVLKGGKRVQ